MNIIKKPTGKSRYRLYAMRYALYAFFLLLSSCGLSPVYGTQSGDAAPSQELRYVEILQIKDRVGQELRNHLSLSMPAPAYPAKYRLQVSLSEIIDDFGLRRDTTATFARLSLRADYSLARIGAKENEPPILQGALRAVGSYNILESTFATLSAEEDARSRAAKQLADDIKLRLATYFQSAEGAAR